jgi:dihydroorotate dehydrogenase electron transfer subunit
MFRRRCPIVANDPVAPGHYVMRLRGADIAAAARPGQFVQVLCGDCSDPLLPRPFSFLTADRREFAFLYHVVGKGTELLSRQKPGASLWILGPLGRGFDQSAARGRQALLVGGGVGIPPLVHLAQQLAGRRGGPAVRVFLGARDRSLLLCEKDFKKLGVALETATDDGSRGHKGFVTAPLEAALRAASSARTQVYACGPTPMLAAVSRLCGAHRVRCEVSVEVPMACGFGACLGCAIRVSDPGAEAGYRYAIACQEGPVFDGSRVAWA